MLYYIWLCSNKCHVVITSVTQGRNIAMQGHSCGCQISGTWVMEPGCRSQHVHTNPSCWSLGPESHRLLTPLGGPVPAGRGAGHLQKPEKYTSCFPFLTLTEDFGGPRQNKDKDSSEKAEWQHYPRLAVPHHASPRDTGLH